MNPVEVSTKRPSGAHAPSVQQSHHTEQEVHQGNATALIAVAAFSCLVVTLLQSLVIPALPTLPSTLGSSATTVSWMVTGTLLTGAVATPVFGRFGDMFSRRAVMVIAMGLVFIGSCIAPLGGMTTIIIGRALQGVGTALIPVAMAVMRHNLSGPRLGGALALLSAMLGVGGGLGIPLGGVILSLFNWQAMFWFAAILSALSILAMFLVVPSNESASGERFDILGAVLLALGLTSLLTSISQGAAWGWGSALTLGLLVAGVVFFLVWGAYELRQQSPLVNLRTTLDRPVLLVNVASLLLGLLMFTNLLLTTLELQNPAEQGGFGWAASAAGLAMLPSAAAMLAVAPISSHLASRFGARAVILIGSAIITLGYALRLGLAANGALVIVWATVVSVGVGIGYAGLPMMLVQYVPARETGSANAVNALMRSIGMAASSAMVAAISAAMIVTSGGLAVPSASALNLLAIIGIVLGAGAMALSASAKYRGETIIKRHHDH